jgi:hypothetical protein
MVDAIERLAHALHPDAFTTRAAPPEDSGTGFSLWGLVLADAKSHRLKPVPLTSADSNPIVEEACACDR